MNNFADDDNLAIKNQCLSDEYACCAAPQQCIPYAKRCDGIVDCADGEDENNCPTCSINEFPCLIGGTCIPMERRCNGMPDDCFDNSNADEKYCECTCHLPIIVAWENFTATNQIRTMSTAVSMLTNVATGTPRCSIFALRKSTTKCTYKTFGVTETQTVPTALMKYTVNIN
ncbi:Low-density lipo protein receptor-related protein 5 [Trichinella spiralis]|uniref:Low-density lipo protein receptor-related protein 5 n=1 Tax=Trichinella spiralis TaxID=6334 RepID=UPI0001EFEF72|nr:Low-density lipo protein receptor-related protein 5 [Trichinella spiralis]